MAYGTADEALLIWYFGKIKYSYQTGTSLTETQLHVWPTRRHSGLVTRYPGTEFTLTCL